MAITRDLVELLKGQDATEVSGFIRGEWSQNLWRFSDSTEVRPGWGQVAELDTTLGLNVDSTAIGYEEHLGSCSVETPFGHNQILSVFRGRSSTSCILGEAHETAAWAYLYFVRIYDLTTDRHYEEVLYRQTSELADTQKTYPMSLWHGNYETDMTKDHSSFTYGADGEFFFHTFDGYIYFGNAASGTFVYRPADFREIRNQWTEKSELAEYSSGYSESSILSRISFIDGSFPDNYRYLNNSDISRVVDVASLLGRTVYATGRTIYLSDPFKANAVIATNQVTIPSEFEITAIEALRDKLLIFTRTEAFVFVPSVGAIASQGRVVKVSENIGTFSPNTVVRGGDSLFVVSDTGIYRTNNGTSFTELSVGISNFFNGLGSVTSPMTSFFESAAYTALNPFGEGFTNISTNEQPRTLIKFNEKLVSVAFSMKSNTLLIAFPTINTVWCYKAGWSVWPLESIVKVGGAPAAPIVGVERNLNNPWVVEASGDFYMTVGVDSQQLDDAGSSHAQLLNSGALTTIDGTPRSYAILKLGLGGALDRSCANEDFRVFPQRYLADTIDTANIGYPARQSQGIFYLREPIVDASDGAYWIPLELMPPEILGATINGYVIRFEFDNTNYTASPNGAGVISLKLPPERIGTTANVTGITCTNLGVADPNGDFIQISFTGATINLARKNSNPLAFFKLTPLNASTTSSFGFKGHTRQVVDSAAGSATPNIYCFSPFKVNAEKKINDARAQSVDWAFKAGQKGTRDSQIRARGLYTRMGSRGASIATDGLLGDGWLWGAYNVILGSDRKPYSTQVLDIGSTVITPNITKIVNKISIRSRYRKMTGELAKRTFGGGPVWGEIADKNSGNYLIDDTQLDNIAISDSVKGQELSYLVFGFMRGRAEGLVLESILADVRRIGSRRRTGR